MSILCNSDSEFADSCAPQHYRPPHQLNRVERFVRAVSCLLLFAAMGVIFAVGLSGCGGGDPDDAEAADNGKSSLNNVPYDCRKHPDRQGCKP